MDSPRIRILLVEDNPGDARLVREMLKAAVSPGFHIVHADRLAQARASLERAAFDVVLLDLNLPDSRGTEGVEALAGRSGTAPIIVMTSRDDEETGLEALRKGADDYLVKGRIDDRILSRVIRYAIERRHSRDALRSSAAGLEAANATLKASRAAALNLMEDALEAQRRAEAAGEALGRSTRRAELLAETAERLLVAPDPQEVVQSLCLAVMDHLDCQVFFNFLTEPASRRLRLNACAGIPEAEARRIRWLDYGTAVCGCVARDGARIVAEEIPNTPDPRTELVKSFGVQAYACHPLLGPDGVIGTLSFGTRTRPRFSEEDLSTMKAVADLTAIAMTRVRTEQALRETRDYLESLFAYASAPIICWDPEFRITRFNPAFERLTRRPAAEVLGKELSLLFPPGSREQSLAKISRTLAGEQWEAGEIPILRSDGAIRVVLWNSANVYAAEGRTLLATIAQGEDITERKRAEDALRESESVLRGILDATQESVWLFTPGGDLITGNATAYARFGKPPEALEGKNLLAILPPALAASRGARLREVAATGLPLEFEDERAGILFHHSFYPVKDAAGVVRFVAAYSRDITRAREQEREKERLMDQVRENNAQMEAVFTAIQDTVLVYDADMKAVRANPMFAEIHGFDPVGLHLREILRATQCRNADGAPPMFENQPTPTALRGDTVRNQRLLITRPDGQDMELETSSSPLRVGDRIQGAVTVWHDITERARMERDLRDMERLRVQERSQKIWQTTFDGITDLISIHARDGSIRMANQAFLDAFGLTRETYNRKHCFELFHADGRPHPHCPMERTWATGRPDSYEISEAAGGRVYDVSTYPYLSPEGVIEGCIHIAKDVTERRESEMQLIMNERLAALGQMAAGIAHEINNPLATISGCAEGLLGRTRRSQWDSALFTEYLGIIGEEIARCKAITSSMLSFVRKGDPQRRTMNLHEVLDRTLELVGFQGRLRNVEILKDYAPSPVPATASEVELKQVFVAMFSNALDAMRDAGRLEIATRREDSGLLVRIRDTGQGIPAGIEERIFDPFFTTKHSAGGTGLGLSIARRIVESLGGTIVLEGSSAAGTTFALRLPAAEEPAEREPAPGISG